MKKSDVAIGIVPTEAETRFFIKNEGFAHIPSLYMWYDIDTQTTGMEIHDIDLVSYEDMLCMAALFDAVAKWIKPETPKKVKKIKEIAVKQTGWLSPTGDYYPTARNMLHQEVAEQIWAEGYADQPHSPETWANVQTDLLRKGWLRFDYSDIMFMRRPTESQKVSMEAMLAWKIKNPDEYTSLDMGALEKMQRICMWLDGDAVEDYQDLEDEIERTN